MNLVNQKIGAEGNITVDLTAGVLTMVATENTPGVQISINAAMPLTYLIDAGAQKMNSPLLTSVSQVLDGILKAMT